MHLSKVAVLSEDEAKEKLVAFWTETIANDKRHLKELISNGTFFECIPDVPKLDAPTIASYFQDLLSESLASEMNTEYIFIRGNDGKLHNASYLMSEVA